MRRVVVLGSTGSVGRSTLDVIASQPDTLRLLGIAARSRIDLMEDQIAQFDPALIGVWEPDKAQALAQTTGRKDVMVGAEALERLASHPDADVVVIATAGREALLPLISAIKAGKHVALASKELLVMAGKLLMHLIKEHGTTLIPIDSEHAGLFQCLQGVSKDQVRQILVTGSGGPLWLLDSAAQSSATREQILAHPKWKMGKKITVDSATMMNKGLEVIEARWLFGMPLEQIKVVVHPEAVVHALIELYDGTFLAQLSPCDMRIPIQFALSYPTRWPRDFPRLELSQLSELHFCEPDLGRFPCLRLALEAASSCESACVVLNGANDIAVAAYLEGKLSFAEIPNVIEEILQQHAPADDLALDAILELDEWSRRTAERLVHQWLPR